MQSKCGTSCEGGDKDSPIRFQRVETGKNRQKTIDDLKKVARNFRPQEKVIQKFVPRKLFSVPQTRSQVSAYDVMAIKLQIVQTLSPVFFKSLRRCSRELGPVGDLVNLGFSYRGVCIGEKVIGDLSGSWDWVYNRGLGPVGELGLSMSFYRGKCYRGIGLSG